MNGGQSMSKVLMGGNQFGNYPVALVGEYAPRLTRDTISKIEAATDEATLHQFGACRLPGGGKVLADKIVMCLRAGLVVAEVLRRSFGNSPKIRCWSFGTGK